MAFKGIKPLFAALATTAMLSTAFAPVAEAGGRPHKYAIGNCWANGNCVHSHGYRHHYRDHRNRGHGNDAALLLGGIFAGVILNEALRPRPRYYHNPPPTIVYRNPPPPPPVIVYREPQVQSGYPIVGSITESGTNIARPVVQGYDGQLCVAVQGPYGNQFYDITANGQNIDYGGGPRTSTVCQAGPT